MNFLNNKEAEAGTQKGGGWISGNSGLTSENLSVTASLQTRLFWCKWSHSCHIMIAGRKHWLRQLDWLLKGDWCKCFSLKTIMLLQQPFVCTVLLIDDADHFSRQWTVHTSLQIWTVRCGAVHLWYLKCTEVEEEVFSWSSHALPEHWLRDRERQSGGKTFSWRFWQVQRGHPSSALIGLWPNCTSESQVDWNV